MKLELKHVAPYNGHKVELSYLQYKGDKKRIKAYLHSCGVEGIETTYKRKRNGCVGDCMRWDGNNNINDLDVKLLLRPMSDLTKEIEHNGERFVPISRIDSAIDIDYPYVDMDSIGFSYEEASFRDFEKLLNQLAEWHLNYMNLDESLWIPKK